MDERQQLGRRIKQLRRRRGYTQERLAERMDINAKYLSSIERGVENPTLDLLVRLAHSLEVDLHELFQGAPDEEPPERLRRTIDRFVAEMDAEELSRLVRILEALVQ
jgi:transcriptional regulator with XRE-family HTH domain